MINQFFLYEIVKQDFLELGSQTFELFLEDEAERNLVREAAWFRTAGLLEKSTVLHSDLSTIDEANTVYSSPPIVKGSNAIISSYSLKPNSITGSSTRGLEILVVSDFENLSLDEYSHEHKSTFEKEYSDILTNKKLSNMITVPTFIRGRNGLIRVMNFSEKEIVEFDKNRNELKNKLTKLSSLISLELSFNQMEIVFPKGKINSEIDLEITRRIAGEWVGGSVSHTVICKLMAKACKTNHPVLILGESGTGKTELAKVIAKHSDWINGEKYPKHKLSVEKNIIKESPSSATPKDYKPEIEKLNVAAVSADLFESELFGITSGAASDVKGKLGILLIDAEAIPKHICKTVLLDEIGDLSVENQVKLLLAIEEKSVKPTGQNSSMSIAGTRIIASTNRNVDDSEVFRQDLKNRFRYRIYIPPLRERIKDVRPIVDYRVNWFWALYKRKITVSPKIYSSFENYSWPGNTRELIHTIDDIIYHSMSSSGTIELNFDSLPKHIRDSNTKEISLGDKKVGISDFEFKYPDSSLLISITQDELKVWKVLKGAKELLKSKQKISYQSLADYCDENPKNISNWVLNLFPPKKPLPESSAFNELIDTYFKVKMEFQDAVDTISALKVRNDSRI